MYDTASIFNNHDINVICSWEQKNRIYKEADATQKEANLSKSVKNHVFHVFPPTLSRSDRRVECDA